MVCPMVRTPAGGRKGADMAGDIETFNNQSLVLGLSLLMKELNEEFFGQAREQCETRATEVDRELCASALTHLKIIHAHIEQMRQEYRRLGPGTRE